MAKRAFLDVYQSRVATALAVAGTSLTLDSVSGLSAYDVLLIDEGNTKAEIVYVTAISTTTKIATIVRAIAGTTDVSHGKGAIVKKAGWKNTVTLFLTDVSTGETLALLPPKGILTKISTVLGGAIGSGDAVLTFSKGSQAITNGVITIAYNSSALGDVDSVNPTLYNEFNGSTDYLKVVNGGASSNTEPLNIICEFICLED